MGVLAGIGWKKKEKLNLLKTKFSTKRYEDHSFTQKGGEREIRVKFSRGNVYAKEAI